MDRCASNSPTASSEPAEINQPSLAEDRRNQALHIASMALGGCSASALIDAAEDIEAYLEGPKDPPPPAILVEHLVKAAAAAATCADTAIDLRLQLTVSGIRVAGTKGYCTLSQFVRYEEIVASDGYCLRDRMARIALALR